MSYIGVSPFTNTVRTVTRITANGSVSVFYPDGGYTKGYVDVFVAGEKKVDGVDFVATDSLQIGFIAAPANNSIIEIVAYRPVSLNVIDWGGVNNKPDPQITLSGDASGNVILNDLTSNTLSLTLANTTVVANAYGNSSQIPVITVDSKGRITNATTTAVAGVTGFAYEGSNNTFSITTGDGSTFKANISANSIAALALGSTGVVANAYGNSTAIPVITIDEDGRISNATTTSVSGVTGVSYAPANSTITVSTSTTDYNAVVNSGNSSVQGLLKVVDSVSNSSATITASANSVKVAYELAGNAVSNATSYAATAYSNAVATASSDATTKAGTAYSNAVSVAASDATSKAGTAYSNAVSQATTLAGTAYSNAVSTASSDATTKANTAYSNAVSTAASDATSKSDTAYSNAVSQATTLAGTAYSNAVSQATTLAGTAYSNAVSQATTLAGTAYSNAVSQATTLAGTAYSNATTFAANADNISSGTLSGARVQANNGIVGNTSGVFVKAGTGITVNTTGVHTNQDISNTANVTFGYMTITGNLVVQGTTTTVNTVTLSVQDNMIYLNSNNTVTNPDLGFAGNYNDGTYHHAGFFRDSTDSRWKVFDNYLPEPDASPYIDTSNTSFQLANFQANVVYANLTGDVTGNVSGSANSATYLGGNTAGVLRSYSDTVAGTAYSNAVSVAASDATTKAGTAYSNATSYAATIAGTAYSNATSYAATIASTAYSNAVSTAASDATTKAGTAYSNATSYASNASNISSGTLSGARLPQANTTSNGAVIFLDSVSNTSTSIYAPTMNAVKTAYDLAGNAVSNATSYAATAYSNAVSTAASDATTKAGTAYSNAVSYADTKAGTAYSNATSYAATIAGTAYSNAVSVASSDATSKAATAYSNATSYAATIAGTAYSNATSYAATIAGTAYSNAVAYAASNSYVNSTFLPLAGGTMTGSIANGTFTTQLTVAGRTRIYGSGIADLLSTGNDVGLCFGGGAIFPTDGALNLTNNTKALGNSSYAFSSINLGTAAYAPIFYDSADTTYYVDPAGGANLYANTTSFVINGGSASSAGPVITSSSTDGPKLSIKNTSSGGKDLWWISNGSGNADGAGKLQLWNNTNSYTALTFASTSGGNHALYSAYTSMAGSARAPLFYDTDDTSFYINAAGTSVINAMNSYGDINNYQAIGAADDVRQGIVAYDSTAMAANVGGQIVLGYKYLSDGSYTQGAIIKTYKLNSTSGDYSSGLKFQVRDTGEALATRVWIDPSGNLFSDQSVRAPLFYDSNNTSYYVDPASTSVMNTINQVGVYGRNQSGSGWLSGNYSSVETTSTSGAIYSIGGSYVPGTTTLGNMYGIGYSYSGYAMGNPGGTPSSLWGMYVADNGTARIFLDGTNGRGYFAGLVQSQTDVRAPIFYDSDNTAYYANPAGNSQFSLIYADNWFRPQGQTGVYSPSYNIHFWAQSTTDWSMSFGGNTDGGLSLWQDHQVTRRILLYYNTAGSGLLTNTGNWGVRQNYDGGASPGGTLYGSWISNGDHRAPIFYDYDNTAYYVDPASTTVLNALNAVTKSFLIDHPTKHGKKLRYACLEGPENGVYVRGKLTNENTIELPEYWTKLVDPDSISVSLTPIGKGQKLSVLDISNNQVVIEEEDSKDINCFYVVYGERVDVDKLEVEV